MAKKAFGFETREQPTEKPSVSKLPIDSTGAGKAMADFQEIPVDMLHTCTLKGSSDYSKYGSLRQEQMVESIKQMGVLQPLIVRKSAVQMSKYEILAGERRWENAKAAGLKTVPCRIMNVDDKKASAIFHLTNLMNRDLTPTDKIYGWYNYYTQVKEVANPNEAVEGEVTKAMAQGQEDVASLVGGKTIALRTIQMYVKMHDLINPWLGRLDEKQTTMRIGYHIAFFPPEIQEELLGYKITETKIMWLKKVYEDVSEGRKWYDGIIADNFDRLGSTEEPKEDEKKPPVRMTKEEKERRRKTREQNLRFKQALPEITTTIWERLRPQDYDNAGSVIAEALELYYSQHNE